MRDHTSECPPSGDAAQQWHQCRLHFEHHPGPARCDERRLVALRVLLEEMSYEETTFIEDLERALSLKQVTILERPGKVPRVKVS